MASLLDFSLSYHPVYNLNGLRTSENGLCLIHLPRGIDIISDEPSKYSLSAYVEFSDLLLHTTGPDIKYVITFVNLYVPPLND